jgi:hypothetical protein
MTTSMMKNTLLFYFTLVSLLTFSCGPDNSLRNKIVFEDDTQTVADSIAKMDLLLNKLPGNMPMNYFMDNNGNLYVNNDEIGELAGAINNPRIRRNSVFNKFNDDEIDQFFNLIDYLLKNHIDGARMNPRASRFMFVYRRSLENRYHDIRLVNLKKEGLNSFYSKEYQILDNKGSLVLVAPKDAKIR